MGSCDWKAITHLREHLSIPIFANGGIACKEDVDRCIEETKVNGVMVGEALLENPALFTNGVDPSDGHLLTVVRYAECGFRVGGDLPGVLGSGEATSCSIWGNQGTHVQTAVSGAVCRCLWMM